MYINLFAQRVETQILNVTLLRNKVQTFVNGIGVTIANN